MPGGPLYPGGGPIGPQFGLSQSSLQPGPPNLAPLPPLPQFGGGGPLNLLGGPPGP